MSVIVGLLSIHLHLPGTRSLKEKRMVLKRLKDRLKKFNIAIAETDHHDLWQRAELSVVTISNEGIAVEQALTAIENEIERIEPGLVTEARVEFLR